MITLDMNNPRHAGLIKMLTEMSSEDAGEPENVSITAAMDPDRAGPILRDHAKDWNRPNTFMAGDLIKPTPQSKWKSILGHCLVWRTYDLVDVVCEHGHVQKHDMRILTLNADGSASETSAHSHDFELVERITE